MSDQNPKPGKGMLKGTWGFIEIISIAFIIVSLKYSVIQERPSELTPQALKFYVIISVLGILGLCGIISTGILRLRIKKNPELHEKYIKAAKPKPSVQPKSKTSLKQFLLVLLLGCAIAFSLLAFIINNR